MPTHEDGARSFDFADLAAEAVSAVEVYKTSNATLPTGGIGSTINIKTTKPLEARDRTLSFGIKAVNDTSTEAGDSWTPEISGIYVDQFADGKFGLAMTAIYQERDTGVENANGRGWWPNRGDDAVLRLERGAAAKQSGPASRTMRTRSIGPRTPQKLYSVNQQLQYRREEFSRTRTNGQLTLQWDPDRYDSRDGRLHPCPARTGSHLPGLLGAWFAFAGGAGVIHRMDRRSAGRHAIRILRGLWCRIRYANGRWYRLGQEHARLGRGPQCHLGRDGSGYPSASTTTIPARRRSRTAISAAACRWPITDPDGRAASASGFYASDLPILDVIATRTVPPARYRRTICSSAVASFTNTVNEMDDPAGDCVRQLSIFNDRRPASISASRQPIRGLPHGKRDGAARYLGRRRRARRHLRPAVARIDGRLVRRDQRVTETIGAGRSCLPGIPAR